MKHKYQIIPYSGVIDLSLDDMLTWDSYRKLYRLLKEELNLEFNELKKGPYLDYIEFLFQDVIMLLVYDFQDGCIISTKVQNAKQLESLRDTLEQRLGVQGQSSTE